MRRPLTLFIALSSLLALVLPIEPSFRLLLDDTQIDELEAVIIKVIESQVSTIDLEPFDLEEKVDMLGTVGFNISYPVFRLTKLAEDGLKLKFSDLGLIEVMLSGFEGQLEFLYTVDSNFYSNQGEGIVKIFNLELEAQVSLFTIQNKYEPYKRGPCLNIKRINITSIDFDFNYNKEGALEGIMTSFLKTLQPDILQIVNTKINEDSFNKVINEKVKSIAKSLQLKMAIPNTPYSISYSMNQDPIYQNHSMQLSLEMTVLDNITTQYKGQSYPLPDSDNTGEAVDFLLSQYVIENALEILFNQKLINFYINDAVLDPWFIPISLFVPVIPQFEHKYKIGKHVDLKLTASSKPIINLSASMIKLAFYYKIGVIVPYNETYKEKALEAETIFEVEAMFNIENGRIHAEVDKLTMKQFKVTYSTIGEVLEEDVLKAFERNTNILLIFINGLIVIELQKFHFPVLLEAIHIERLSMKAKENFFEIGISPYLKPIKPL